MSKDTGGSAFPHNETDHAHNLLSNRVPGMTLRDYFAAKVMEGLIASHEEGYWWKCNSYTMGARYSYRFADAMLKERGK